jgi:hypothetical protein
VQPRAGGELAHLPRGGQFGLQVAQRREDLTDRRGLQVTGGGEFR